MAYQEMNPWLMLQRWVKVDEKREPLKSKDNKGSLNGEQASKKPTKPLLQKKPPGSYEKEHWLEKPGAICLWTWAKSPLLRAVPASESLGEELSQAILRTDMGLEKDYAYDIFNSMMQNQPRYTFQRSDLPRAVTAEMRVLVVDWLVQVHEYLNLADDTLYLAVYLMNAYMKASKVRVSNLQLLSITCLFLACKLEESICPKPAQLCFMTKDSVSRKDLLRMERKVLGRLRFQLHYATNPLQLLRLLVAMGNWPLEAQYLALYFLEFSLVEMDCVHFEPAQLSLAALTLAQRLLQEAGTKEGKALLEGSPWLHMYSEAQLSAVFPYLAKAALLGPNSAFRATFLKYSRPQKLCTSTSTIIAASEYLRCFLGSPTP